MLHDTLTLSALTPIQYVNMALHHNITHSSLLVRMNNYTLIFLPPLCLTTVGILYIAYCLLQAVFLPSTVSPH